MDVESLDIRDMNALPDRKEMVTISTKECGVPDADQTLTQTKPVEKVKVEVAITITTMEMDNATITIGMGITDSRQTALDLWMLLP